MHVRQLLVLPSFLRLLCSCVSICICNPWYVLYFLRCMYAHYWFYQAFSGFFVYGFYSYLYSLICVVFFIYELLLFVLPSFLWALYICIYISIWYMLYFLWYIYKKTTNIYRKTEIQRTSRGPLMIYCRKSKMNPGKP